MKNFFFLMIFAAQFVFGQNYRFVYEYRFAPLKAKPDSLVTEYMNLDTDGKLSYFYNATKYENDSVSALKTGMPMKKLPNINISYIIVKDLKNKNTRMEVSYKGTPLQIPENEAIKWNLTKDFITIGKWKTQKATAKYKGRNWTAWFAVEIPVADGPYKFSGLPGLVVKLSDDDHEHNFELIQVKKLTTLDFSPYKNPKEISAEKYAALETYFPLYAVEMMNVTKEGMEIRLKDGNSVNYSRNFIDNNRGKLDAILTKKLGAGDNPIERK